MPHEPRASNETILTYIRAHRDLTGSQIAEHFDVSKNVIMGLAHRNGVTVGRGRHPNQPARVREPRRATIDPTMPDRGCQWINGDPKTYYSKCGAPRVDGKPYCQAHCRRAYRPRETGAQSHG